MRQKSYIQTRPLVFTLDNRHNLQRFALCEEKVNGAAESEFSYLWFSDNLICIRSHFVTEVVPNGGEWSTDQLVG